MTKYFGAILYFLILLFVTSCDEVNFSQPQPAGVESLGEFPAELQGFYVSTDKDTLFVEALSLSLYNRSNPCDKLSEQDSLRELVVLKKWKDYYFLSINEYGYWSVLMIDFEASETAIISMLSSDDEAKLSKLQELTAIDKIKDEDGEIIYYIIDPEPEKLLQIIEQEIFTPISTFRKIGH